MSHDRGCFRCHEDHPHARAKSGECRIPDCPYKEKPMKSTTTAEDIRTASIPLGPDLQQVPRQHILKLGWETIHTAIDSLAYQLSPKKFELVVGISRGGLIPATMIAHQLGLRVDSFIAQSYEGTRRTLQKPLELVGWKETFAYKDVLIVDDIMDSGETYAAVIGAAGGIRMESTYATLVYKTPNRFPSFKNYFAQVSKDTWVKFPWEGDEA